MLDYNFNIIINNLPRNLTFDIDGCVLNIYGFILNNDFDSISISNIGNIILYKNNIRVYVWYLSYSKFLNDGMRWFCNEEKIIKEIIRLNNNIIERQDPFL